MLTARAIPCLDVKDGRSRDARSSPNFSWGARTRKREESTRQGTVG